jgi:hypothetical protein
MALTPEQQSQLDFQEASDAARRAHEIAMEQRRTRLEAIRLAKETLVENARSKPVDSRDVSATDVTNFANTLVQYVNQ